MGSAQKTEQLPKQIIISVNNSINNRDRTSLKQVTVSVNDKIRELFYPA